MKRLLLILLMAAGAAPACEDTGTKFTFDAGAGGAGGAGGARDGGTQTGDAAASSDAGGDGQ